MNQHARIHPTTPANPAAPIDILELEDTINQALNAALMVHDYIEDMLHRISRPGIGEECNTAGYAVGHMRECVRAAHDHFHGYLQQWFAEQRVDKESGRIPDPQKCPTFAGDGLYRFVPMAGRDMFHVRWWAEMSWFELTVPETGERAFAFAPELFERNVIEKVAAKPVAHEVDDDVRAAIDAVDMAVRIHYGLLAHAENVGHDREAEGYQAGAVIDALERLRLLIGEAAT